MINDVDILPDPYGEGADRDLSRAEETGAPISEAFYPEWSGELPPAPILVFVDGLPHVFEYRHHAAGFARVMREHGCHVTREV